MLHYRKTVLLCCPEFSPQMTGGDLNPGEEIVKASLTQSPMEPPVFAGVVLPVSVTSPVWGPARVRVWTKGKELYPSTRKYCTSANKVVKMLDVQFKALLGSLTPSLHLYTCS